MSGPELVFIGAGAQARCISTFAVRAGRKVKGFVDAVSNDVEGRTVNGLPVVCGPDGIEDTLDPESVELVLAYGSPSEKKALDDRLKGRFRFGTVIDPSVTVCEPFTAEEGLVVFPGAAFLPDCRLGRHVKVDPNAVVAHDNVLEDFANIGLGVHLAGYVTVGKCATVFSGATVVPKVKIGKNAVVSAGSVVFDDVGEGATVMGNPARRILNLAKRPKA